MANKTIADLPALQAVSDETLIPVYQPGAANPAQKMKGKQFREFAEASVKPYSDSAEQAARVATGCEAGAKQAWTGVQNAIKNIPAGSTPIVNDLTTGGAKMALSAEMGKVLGQRPNPNLLRNAHFAQAINQRGVLSMAAGTSGVFIDGWKSNGGGVVSVSSGAYLYMGSGSILYQLAEVDIFGGAGAILTVSYQKASTGEVFSKTATFSSYTGVGDISISVNHTAKTVYVRADKDMSMNAIKLELGSVQTLAHQDASGNWVLNEIPDKNEELLKCCMSTADATDTYANNKKTAAAINALALDGSNAMTGDLTIQKTGDPFIVMSNVQKGAFGRLRIASDASLGVENFNTSGKRVAMFLQPPDVANKVNAIGLLADFGTGEMSYPILHTGNKPSGSYTGNGSATARTINTGGIGDALLIYNSYNVGIITKYSAFVIATQGTNAGTVKTFKNPDLYFAGGVLYCATADTWVNGNGTVYNYQVP